MPPRALYITSDKVGSPGGGGSVTRHESQGLQELFGETLVLDHDVVPYAYLQLDLPCLWDYYFLARLHQTDLSQVRLAHCYSGSYTESIRYLKSLSIPVVYTCPAHDWQVSKEEHLAQGLPYDYYHLTAPEISTQFFEGLRLADLVIAPSRLSERFLRTLGVERIQIIPHGFDPAPVREFSKPPAEFTLGYLGQTGPDKGLRYLVQAWGELAYTDAKLILAGRGTDQLGGMVQRYAGAGRFELWGYVSDASELYRACSAYVQPSVTEAFGIEVLEALWHGLIPLVSDGAGAVDVLDYCPGYQFLARDVAALKKAITLVRENPLSGWGRISNLADYRWSEIIQRYKAVWLKLANL